MPAFRSLFFHRRAKEWVILTGEIPSTHLSEEQLKSLANMYSGTKYQDGKVIERFLRTQENGL